MQLETPPREAFPHWCSQVPILSRCRRQQVRIRKQSPQHVKLAWPRFLRIPRIVSLGPRSLGIEQNPILLATATIDGEAPTDCSTRRRKRPDFYKKKASLTSQTEPADVFLCSDQRNVGEVSGFDLISWLSVRLAMSHGTFSGALAILELKRVRV